MSFLQLYCRIFVNFRLFRRVFNRFFLWINFYSHLKINFYRINAFLLNFSLITSYFVKMVSENILNDRVVLVTGN
jgi:hypothetical protein